MCVEFSVEQLRVQLPSCWLLINQQPHYDH